MIFTLLFNSQIHHLVDEMQQFGPNNSQKAKDIEQYIK